jgi:uncharacterized cupredoxin-like copper-binding protein
VGEDHLRRAAACAIAGVIAVLAAGGCGGDSQKAADTRTVTVKERDFRVSAPKVVAPGPVHLNVVNKGPVAHELIVALTGGGKLPIGPDGINVDEERLEVREVAELEPEEPGSHSLQVNLRPGHYVLLCNMAGHFKGGMHTEMLVR